MPTVNVYYRGRKDFQTLSTVVPKLQTYLADRLSCSNIHLRQDAVSVRLLPVRGRGMLGTVELDITAHEFPDRVAKQDQICRETKTWLEKEAKLRNVRVWLRLSQLGHDKI